MDYTKGNGLSGELQAAPEMCVPTRRNTLTTDEARVLAWLKLYSSTIVTMESKYNIDRRAIAGAIAWEALNNVKSSAYFHLWSGPGKVHTYGIASFAGVKYPSGKPSVAEETENSGYLPSVGDSKQRYEKLKDATSSIAYIAAIMRAGADISEENGFFMNNDPAALTEFYQGWDLARWRATMKAKKPGTAITGKDAMSVWVGRNLDYLEDAVGPSAVKQQSINARTYPSISFPQK